MTAKKAGDGHYSMPLYLPGPVHDHVKAVAEIRKISKSEVVADNLGLARSASPRLSAT